MNLKEKEKLAKLSLALDQSVDENILKDLRTVDGIKKNISESAKKNFLKDLIKVKNEVDLIEKNIPIQPSLEDLEEHHRKVKPAEQPKKEVVKEQSLIEKAAQSITNEIKEQKSFQQPNPPIVGNEIGDIRKKIRYLEQWVGKISAHGAGGGDANPFDRVEWMERGIRFEPKPRMAYWNNTEDCLNITHADGSTLQVGLENYITVYNDNAETQVNGMFVEFTGVDPHGDNPTFRPFVNDANAEPLYSIGVLTTDVLSNTHGRATQLGLVREVNTTGSDVGETWSQGDVLWASPSYPGKYTNVKPTAPNIALSVAAVTKVDATDGIMLVRPTRWPRLYYADYDSEQNQIATAINTEQEVRLSNTLFESGFVRSGNAAVALESGLYKFDVRAQLSSTNSSQKSMIYWFKKNGVNIEYSAVRQSVATNAGYATITDSQVVSMDKGDNVTMAFSVDDTALFISSPAVFDGAPNIPAVQLAITEVAL